MRNVTIKRALPFMVVLLLCSCGGGYLSNKNMDVPYYAWGKISYFAPREGKGVHAFIGFADGRLGKDNYGMLSTGRDLSGTLVILDGKNVNLLYTSTNSFGNYIIEEDSAHIMHALWHEGVLKNHYNSSLQNGKELFGSFKKKIEGNYADSYLFAKRKDIAEAVDYLKNLEKQPNQPSRYNPAEHGGTKTYKAKVGKQVEYVGNDSLKLTKFQSLYLDCGAVVECYYKGWNSNLVGRTIDCVTDDENKVIIYELIKE